MSSTYGEKIKLSIFGQSHGKAIGMVLDDVPAGLKVDEGKLQAFLARRAPGNSSLVSGRSERDKAEFLSGIVDGYTCGAPIAAIISNEDAKASDYERLRQLPRPGHGDFTAQVKYGGFQDASGGGHFSGRLTAPLCIAGGLCKQWLEGQGIEITAKMVQVGRCKDPEALEKEIQQAKLAGDSVGGIIECVVTGLPAGLGDPMFAGMENRIAGIVFGIPGVKGLEFGSGFYGASLFGSENNDEFIVENGTVRTKTNHCGGILGGITTGMPLVFRVAVKPTPSIAKPQQTVNMQTLEPETIAVSGRHDPCIALRAVPVVEAAAAIAIFDCLDK